MPAATPHAAATIRMPRIRESLFGLPVGTPWVGFGEDEVVFLHRRIAERIRKQFPYCFGEMEIAIPDYGKPARSWGKVVFSHDNE
jgi:hypothetical protein